MAIRFAPFATVKVLSLATKFWEQKLVTADDSLAFSQAVTSMLQTSVINNVEDIKNNFETLFDDIGLADSISISEDYGTRGVYGIGEPTNPSFVPQNVNVRVTISRLTTDAKSVADYALKPLFYYDQNLQRTAINASSAAGAVTNVPNTSNVNVNSFQARRADNLFHVYFGLSDLEHNKSFDNITTFDYLNNYQIVEFMPTSFTKRISSDNATIFTEVEGTGKLHNLYSLLRLLNSSGAANI